jgi:hypothetical protein
MTRLKKMLGILAVIPLLCLMLTGCVGLTLTAEITSPQDGAKLSESSVTVSGNVSDSRATVTINGIEAQVAQDGSFSAEVELSEGENIIEVVAVLGEQKSTDSITVTYNPAAPTGTVEVHVTDAKPENNVTSINVTVSLVEIHKAEDGGGEGEWLSLNVTMPTFDLIELKEGGLEEILASGNVTAGKYTQTRMTIEKVEVTVGGGEPQETTIPSGELKFVRPFDVVEGQIIALLLDFDADESVTLTGAGEIIVRPVVTLTFISPAPNLSLEIISPEDGAELTESPVTVTGNVSDAAAAVTVNGIEAEVAGGGTFSAQVDLVEGENTINAVATLGEEEAQDSITVTYAPSALTLTSIAVEPASPANLAE